MKGFQKFPSIGQAYEMMTNADKLEQGPGLTFRPKLKLHGTNACVRISADGSVTVQRRKADLVEGESHFGFEKWVAAKDNWGDLAHSLNADDDMYIYGEWAGKGIQRKSDAVTQMDEKMFFVFAVNVYDEWTVDPLEIEAWTLSGCHVIPWYGTETVTFVYPYESERSVDQLATMHRTLNETIGVCDEFIKDLTGVSAPGEGLVYYPLRHSGFDIHPTGFDLAFKLKTEAHKTVNRQRLRKPGQKPTEAEQAFAEAYVTPARLEQGVFEVTEGGRLEAQQIGDFIRWISEDVHKECQADLEKAELKWKRIARIVGRLAANHAKSIVFKF